jgi:hypothetical protein
MSQETPVQEPAVIQTIEYPLKFPIDVNVATVRDPFYKVLKPVPMRVDRESDNAEADKALRMSPLWRYTPRLSGDLAAFDLVAGSCSTTEGWEEAVQAKIEELVVRYDGLVREGDKVVAFAALFRERLSAYFQPKTDAEFEAEI